MNVFSAPSCPFVFIVCETWSDMSIKLKRRLDIFVSGVWYSKISVFSFMFVLLNLLKYPSVLFPNTVQSTFTGFVLYWCQSLSWRITGSRFWYFCNKSKVIFSVAGRNMFSISVFDGCILSRGSKRPKTWLIEYLES